MSRTYVRGPTQPSVESRGCSRGATEPVSLAGGGLLADFGVHGAPWSSDRRSGGSTDADRPRCWEGDLMPTSSSGSADVPVPRVLIAGAGVAALEAALALRAQLGPDRLTITLLSPNDRFQYPPLAVLQPFQDDEPWTLPLATFAADTQVQLRHGVLSAVDVDRGVARTTEGDELPFAALLVTTGARPDRVVEGAVAFRGPRDVPAISDLLDRAAKAGGGTLAFVVPDAATWSLPIYELALLSSAHLRSRGIEASCFVATAEADPLHVFPAEARAALQAQLDRHDIRLHVGARVVGFERGRLQLADGGELQADHVVALPTLRPRPIEGLVGDDDGFLPIDRHCRVLASPGVYAAGDITAGPVKQGGLACQQADAAAEAIVADLGHPIEPAPYRPVLRGVLLSDEQPQSLRTTLDRPGPGALVPPQPRVRRLAWPSGKIVGHHLSPYLSGLADGPHTPAGAVDVGKTAARRGP